VKVTLAWPREGVGQADQTVDLPDAEARRLIADGMARVPDPKELTSDELDAAAAAEGVDLSAARTVADKRAALKAAKES
jgi:hypothetical protein